MKTYRHKFSLAVIIFSLFSFSVTAQTFKTKDYYQLKNGSEWRYTAPPNWKEGDYVSRIVEDEKENIFRHFDATKAAKLLSLKKKGIYYTGEEFAGGDSVAKFDSPILWFPAKLKIGDRIEEQREFTRIFRDGKTVRGTFEITQIISRLEDVKNSAGDFVNCLRVESETFWDLGDGRKARSINIYHYAKKVGVVKASARFIIINAEGKETVNRLIETDLKSYKIQ